MDFELIFFLIIAGFMLLSQIFKRLARSLKGAEKPVSGWRKALRDFLDELQREMESGREKARAKTRQPPEVDQARWWEELIGPEAEAVRREGEQEEKGVHIKEEEAVVSRKPRQAQPRRDWGRWPEPARAEAAVQRQAEEPAGRPSPKSLRQAIIWSEILGKPVALREPGGRE
jgi:hypothetical protein